MAIVKWLTKNPILKANNFVSLLVGGVFLFFAWSPAAEAAIPSFVNCGAVSGSTNAITLSLPASIAADDILLMFLETAAQTISVANGNGGTWAEVTNSPQTAGANTRLTVFWSRYNGTQGNPATSDSGDHQVGSICAYRGVITAGDPWDVTSGDVDTTSDNSGSIPGATTTGPDRLIVIVGSADDDADTPITAVSNSDLVNISAARVNAETNQGNDGGLTVFDGEKASAASYGTTALTYTAATTKGMMTIALKPSVTTIGDGTDPGNSSIAPGDSATDLDTFTLQTDAGTDTVTAATVSLSAGSSGGLSLVAITNNAGSITYCLQSNPASDAVSLSSCSIPVTTTLTSFKIRLTPKTHANMPSPPGSTYTVTGTITAFTSTNSQSGTDTNSATVTIDNASPANVTSASGTAGDSQVSLSWTNPADADFHSAIVLRRATSAVADTPVEGTTYIVGNTIGTATVACVVASPTASCTDTGLTNGTAYHYKIFAKDSNSNYSATGVTPTGSPVTPADTTAPGSIANLAITSIGQTSVSLSWTAPGDDNNSGTAASYDMRYSTSAITAGNFSSATAATGEPTPSVAGSSESMTVSGLSASTLYYFAVKTSDEAPNTSAISNVISTTTSATPPTPTTSLGDGTDPGNSSLTPGASATDLDSFTLQTNTGTDTVTAVTVTLASGTSGGLSLLAVTNDAGSTTYCSQSNPSSDAVSLTSCGIPVTTSQTQFKIRLTPRTHANMPSPSGSTYTVTGTVTAFTSTNSQSGSDTDSATITIDNASPANVTSASGTAGDSQVSLSWTNPADGDFHSVVVLRSTSAVSDTPVEGTTYTAGNTIGAATTACVEASPGANCTDTGLTNGTAYHYKIFAKDSNGNYSATGVVPTGSPATPAPSADTTAPGAVTNLAVSTVSASSVGLTWTAPGDDGDSGTAASYDMRYSTSAITAGNFSSATAATGEPTPSVASSSESMTVSGLSASTLYYFAVKTSDEAPNTSAISNVVSATTSAAASEPEPTPTPEAAAVSASGTTGRVIRVSFSGQAYPGSKIEILRKDTSAEDALYLTVPLEIHKVMEDGSFDLSPGALLADEYFFALRAEDKDGRKTRILPFAVDLRTTDIFEVKDILMPPTLDFEKTRIRKGDSLKMVGYATPGNKTEIEIDGKIVSVVSQQKTGYYTFATTTRDFAFGNHYARVRQINGKGTASNFSTARTFQVSQLLVPKADLNQDNIVNITDWSVFLFRWVSKDDKTRLTVDINADGKVDIKDFSIFLGTFSL